MQIWGSTLYELIVRASTELPADVEASLLSACEQEGAGSKASAALEVMLRNVALAKSKRQPICQDTGAILWWVDAPPGLRYNDFRGAVEKAIVRATADGILRQNCVETLTGRNTGNNLGVGSPVIHWQEVNTQTATVSLLLKGGGCENVGIQYSLPDAGLAAERDLEGVRRCLLDAVVRAQGKGCSPGVLGVCIGGDRATGYAVSKETLLRKLGERNVDPELAALERRVLAEANSLHIGPMGFGGETTLLDVLISVRHRIPASYFVSVSYMCWAYRRYRIRTDLNGNILTWL